MNRREAAFKAAFRAGDRLRRASHAAEKALAQCERAGVAFDEVLEALRIEFGDWNGQVERLRKTSEILAAAGARTRLDIAILVDEPLSDRADLQSQAYDDGFLAYQIDQPPESVPHPLMTDQYDAWLRGYYDAKSADACVEEDDAAA